VKNWSDADGGACGAADGADHEKKLHWMIVPGHCWPLTEMPIALAHWFDGQMQEEPVQPTVREGLKYVSRCFPQGSEIPREGIETQVC
jgi:hypothetical protein